MAAMVIGVRYCNNDHLQRYLHLQRIKKEVMEYTKIVLFLLGLLGIVLHNLIKLDGINRQSEGNINLWKYWRMERFSIIISVIVVVVCLIARQEVKQLQQVGNWLGLAFVAIGYMAQSIVVSFMGKAQKIINDKSQ
jgi:cytochrome bd-type quinol oxidase subunit 2